MSESSLEALMRGSIEIAKLRKELKELELQISEIKEENANLRRRLFNEFPIWMRIDRL